MNQFNPSRLKEARNLKKMTIEELANAVGVTKQSISQFENSKAQPQFDTIQTISDVLDFPINFFYEQSDNVKVGNTYFRALFSSNKKDMNSQRIKTSYVAQIHYSLSDYVEFLPINLPNITFEGDFDKLANQVRDFWGLGQEPITDMVSLLERNGIIMSEFSTDGNKIDAFTQYGEINNCEYYCIILGTDKRSFARRQFNCAHELGHILLHEKFDDLNEINRDEFRKRENEANKFAASFLLPKEAFSQDIQKYSNKLNYYIELKRKWKVSIAAMIMRTYDLGIINSNQYQYLMRQISIKGWRTEEPLDEHIVVRRPKAIKQAVNLLLLNNVLTGKQILQLFEKNGLSLSKNVVDEILNLDQDVITIETEDVSSNVKIIPFPKIKE